MRKFTLALLAMLGLASTSAVADNDLAAIAPAV